MIVLPIELHQFSFEICANAGKYVAQVLCRMSLSSLIGQEYDWAMQRLQAFKYELMPNGEQQRNMRRYAG
ncbi:helix-turn-helix domain-containing protein, partial [Cupriavidus necator]|uniref:helix-turn-helix domain-containing protein n=1 Tax=Cupriavidus necator TaxID=106590 RepID=UPI0020BE8B25